MKKKSKLQCDCCGCELAEDELAEDESYWAEGYKDVCRSCYNDIVKTCQLCGDDDVMPSKVSEYILVKAELADNFPPGIYRILRRPFLSIPIIGCGHLWDSDVLFIDKLPRRDADFEISGHICKDCAVPYHRQYRKAFPIRPKYEKFLKAYPGCPTKREKWHAFLKGHELGWEIVRQHTRSVILANPDMLRDLECDTEDNEHKNRFDLPDLPTYHEWLYLEHKGVRVFRCHKFESAWFTLRPEPKYRNEWVRTNGSIFANGIIFDATSLPTWRRDSDVYRYDYPVENRRAIIEAIEQGILTQDGVVLR